MSVEKINALLDQLDNAEATAYQLSSDLEKAEAEVARIMNAIGLHLAHHAVGLGDQYGIVAGDKIIHVHKSDTDGGPPDYHVEWETLRFPRGEDGSF